MIGSYYVLEADGLSHDKKNKRNLQVVSQAEKLAIIWEAVTKIGEAIASIAEVLAIEEEPHAKEKLKMQKQIDCLTAENEKMKNQLNKRRNRWI